MQTNTFYTGSPKQKIQVNVLFGEESNIPFAKLCNLYIFKIFLSQKSVQHYSNIVQIDVVCAWKKVVIAFCKCYFRVFSCLFLCCCFSLQVELYVCGSWIYSTERSGPQNVRLDCLRELSNALRWVRITATAGSGSLFFFFLPAHDIGGFQSFFLYG